MRTCVGSLSLVLGLAVAASSDDLAPPAVNPSSATVDSLPSESASYEGERLHAGLLIDDGVAVPYPYQVTLAQGQIAVNGVPLLRQTRFGREETVDAAPNPPRRRSSTATAGRVERQLIQGLVVLRTLDGAVAEFNDSDALELLRVLCSTEPREKKLLMLLATNGQELNSRQWGRVVDRFEATDQVKTVLARLQSDYDQRSRGLELVHDGSDRTHSYALTVAGMLLVVLAFGTVLTFRPVGGHPWSALDDSTTSVGHVVRCLLLIGILSGFDLLCTMLASRTQQFQELNPLAKLLLMDPQSLIGFKVALTGLAALILYRYRRYYGTQVASWWICLLLTLLTVRWVAVESLLMA